ncbi:MAG: hypothetical protein IBX55_22995 [Methyloprofundus sp.]|nr:hypothetical protein [Methyloprofundus sp.]
MPDVYILRNRLVAFLDVLGFGNMLQSLDVELLHEKYSQFIDDIKTMTFYQAQGDRTGRTNFAHAQIVSDSIILVSNEVDDIYNVNNFIAAVSFLLENGLISRLFLRGAIAYGDFLLDVDRQIFLSKALSEAVMSTCSQTTSILQRDSRQ